MGFIRDHLLQKVFWFLLASVLAGILLASYVVPPLFSGLLQANTEDEAVRLGRHLSSMLFPREAASLALTPEMERELMETLREFRVMKLRIFDPQGLVRFSSDRAETGTRNDREYFREVVRQSVVHTRMVRKDTPSLEGQHLARDVVETYVPVIRDKAVLGVLEVYYDVSEKTRKLHAVLLRSQLAVAVPLLLFLVLCIIFLYRLDTVTSERAAARHELQREHASLRAAHAEIEAHRNRLQTAFVYMSDLIQEVILTGNMQLRYENPHLQSCADLLGCDRKDCPCYGGEPVRCWQIAGTFCGGEIQGTHARKFGNCKDCAVFKAAAADPLAMIGEHFNNMMHLLAVKHENLQAAFAEIETLRGIIPICSFCKKIRNDEGYWGQVESYLEQHTAAKFSHGICPSCFAEHYQEMDGEELSAGADEKS